MHWKQVQKIIDARILSKVNITQEQLFLLRVEVAGKYLELHKPDQKEAYEATPEFWDWWEKIWLAYDRDTLEQLMKEGIAGKKSAAWYAEVKIPEHFKYTPTRDVTIAMYATQDRMHKQAEASIMSEISNALQYEPETV